MATRPPKFTIIPTIPQDGISTWQFATLNAMKENIELLTGTRGDAALPNSAVTRSSITVASPPVVTMQRVTAQGSGYTISGVTVPSIEDYTNLVSNVQQLAGDVVRLRETVNALIIQLKGLS
jgi:hypothetical protein